MKNLIIKNIYKSIEEINKSTDANISLKKEIDTILQSYKNDSISSEKRFALIENTIPESAQVVAWGESTNAALKAKSISVDLVLNQPDINSLIDVLK